MRVLPLQLGMLWLLGQDDRYGETIQAQIKRGREFLIQLTSQDFGYEPRQWHEFLSTTHEKGYLRDINHPEGIWEITDLIAKAENDPAWQHAVKTLLGKRIEPN